MDATTHTLPASEWDFRAVPDGELNACLIWEYSRESPLVRAVAGKWASYFDRVRTSGSESGQMPSVAVTEQGGVDAEQLELWNETRSIRPCFPSPPRDWAWEGMVFSSFGCSRGIDIPWQNLHPTSRERITQHLSRGPGVFTGDAWFTLGKLQRAAVGLPMIELPPNIAKLPDASIIDELGREIVVVVIDWRTHSDPMIQKHLQEWAKGRRPSGIQAIIPSGRGVKTATSSSLRQKLFWLGATRLEAKMTPVLIRMYDKSAWEWLSQGKQDGAALDTVRRNMRRSRKLFIKTFEKFFPTENMLPPLVTTSDPDGKSKSSI